MFGNFGGGMFGGGAGPPGKFDQKFNVYPPTFMDKSSDGQAQVEDGDKIIMPASCLDMLARLRISYPMLFEVFNEAVRSADNPEGRKTHCGVLEFVAPEGRIFLPHWMMQNLYLEPGDVVRIRSITMAKGTYVKFRPQTSNFLKLNNPKATLENKLRGFSALTKGDTIVVRHAGAEYPIDVMEVKPGDAVTIIETDINVDFEAPLDHADGLMGAAAKAKEEAAKAPPPAPEPVPEAEKKDENAFAAFKGQAYSLSGKSAPSTAQPGDVTTYEKPPNLFDTLKGGMATPPTSSEKGTVVPSSFSLNGLDADSSDDENSEVSSTEGLKFYVFGGTGWRKPEETSDMTSE